MIFQPQGRLGAEPNYTHPAKYITQQTLRLPAQLRRLSFCFSLTRPNAIANITINAKPTRTFIFFWQEKNKHLQQNSGVNTI